MLKKKRPNTSNEWWDGFMNDIFKKGKDEHLAKKISLRYSTLASHQIKCVTTHIMRYIKAQFTDTNKTTDIQQLQSIKMLIQLINQHKIFTLQTSESIVIVKLSTLYNDEHPEETLHQLLAEALGLQAHQYEKPDNLAAYGAPVREIIRAVVTISLVEFRDFLAQQSNRNDIQNTIVKEIDAASQHWAYKPKITPSNSVKDSTQTQISNTSNDAAPAPKHIKLEEHSTP